MPPPKHPLFLSHAILALLLIALCLGCGVVLATNDSLARNAEEQLALSASHGPGGSDVSSGGRGSGSRVGVVSLARHSLVKALQPTQHKQVVENNSEWEQSRWHKNWLTE